MLALLCLALFAPSLAQAAEPTWLVGTSSGVTAARALPGERLPKGIRVVRGDAAAARRLRNTEGVRFVEPTPCCRATSGSAPSAPLFGRQWALRSTRARSAWLATLGEGVPV